MNAKYLSIAFSLVATSLFLSAVVGCGGAQKPDGLPKLVPCRAIVTQNGEPLDGATVRLVPQDASARWAVAGVSDEKGVVLFKTHGQFKGAPVGKYAVVVSKEVSETENKKVRMFTLVDPKFTNQTTTDLVLDVSEKGADETFDLGEPVKEFLEEFVESDDP